MRLNEAHLLTMLASTPTLNVVQTIMKALKCKTLGAELAHPAEYKPSTFDDHLPMLIGDKHTHTNRQTDRQTN